MIDSSLVESGSIARRTRPLLTLSRCPNPGALPFVVKDEKLNRAFGGAEYWTPASCVG